MSLTDYSTTAANNNTAPPVGAPEGMAAAAVNNTMREMMANIKAGVGVVVNTTALMTDLDVAKLSDNNVISVTNFSIDGDGGGGLFFYDLTSTATANGGTIFAPDVGVGRFIRVFSGAINPQWFGAVGDETITDDIIPLQAAADAVITNGGSALYLPKIYRTTSPLLISSKLVSIYGDGGDVSGINALSSNGIEFTSTTYDNGSVFFKDFGLTGASGSTADFVAIKSILPPGGISGTVN